MVFPLSVDCSWEGFLIDIKNASVNASLRKKIYVHEHKGFVEEMKEGYVYLLHKALNFLH